MYDVAIQSDNTVKIPSQISTSSLDQLVPILFGASAFQYLNAGCELGVFDHLQEHPGSAKKELSEALQLQARAMDTLLLGLSSLNLIKKTGDKYSNAESIRLLFFEGNWDIFKDVVAFEQHIVYLSQYDFVESLRLNTNVGIKHIPGVGRDLYHRLSENPFLEEVFYKYMDSWTRLTKSHLMENVDFASYSNVLDVGGGTGINAISIAEACPDTKVTVLEIPGTAPITQSNIDNASLTDRVSVHGGDMFVEAFPEGHDCVLFSHQLVIWTPEENLTLLKRAYETLPTGGKLVIFSSISNDEGTGPLMAALDSVYFATLPAEGGMIYSWRQYENWLQEVGFNQIKRINCYAWTPHGIIEAVK